MRCETPALANRAGSGSIYAVSGLLLQATSISKSYAGVHALKDVSFELRAGEVHALVGENGAGKSTLIKIITGAVSPDAGSLTVGGRVAPRMDPHTSRALGIAAIYQQPALFPDLTVAENIALSSERGSIWRRVDWRARRRSAAQLLDRVGASIHPDRIVGTLSMPEQQMVEIAKAIGADARILIMDEPTASLTEREVDRLFAVIHLLREQARASSTSRTGSTRSSRSPIASPCCATARPWPRPRAPASIAPASSA